MSALVAELLIKYPKSLVLALSYDKHGDEQANKSATIQVSVVEKCQEITCSENENKEEVIQNDKVVLKLVELLTMDDHYSVQIRACWILINLAAGTSEVTKTIVDAGAVPILIKLVNCQRENLQEHAVWALRNIIGDGPEYRDLVLKEGIMVPLLRFLWNSEKTSVIAVAVGALVNLCRGNNPAPDCEELSLCLPVLSCMLFHNDKQILINTCCALINLNKIPGTRGNIEAILDVGVCKRLVELLTYPHLPVVESTLSMLDTFAANDDEKYEQMIIDHSALPKLLDLLNSPNETCRSRTCHLISNIVCGNINQKQAVLDAGIFPTLINILDKGETCEKLSAANAVVNLSIGASRGQLGYMVKQGCIPPLINMLSDEDFELVEFILHSVVIILHLGHVEIVLDGELNANAEIIKDCKGLEKIIELKNHSVNNVKTTAEFIIDKYFPQESALLNN